MMLPHAHSIAASAMTRKQMGLQGQYCVMNGPIDKEQLKQIGIDAGGAFLASGGDVDKLYEPAFAALNVLAIAIPAPFNALASIGLAGLQVGADAVRLELKEAYRAAGRYLPVSVSSRVLGDISPKTLIYDAVRDKFAQNASNSVGSMLAVSAYNASASPENKLNITAHARLAHDMYDLAMKDGAKPWQAAMMAYRIGKNTGATPEECAPWANTLMQALAAEKKPVTVIINVDQAEKAWKTLVGDMGGEQVSAEDAKDLPTAEEATNTGLIIGALGAAALAVYMLTRKPATQEAPKAV